MKRIFAIVMVIILVASSVYVGYGMIKEDQSAEDSGAWAEYTGHSCEGGYIPNVLERVTLNSSNLEKTFTLDSGKYFVKSIGDQYLNDYTAQKNHELILRVNSTKKQYSFGIYEIEPSTTLPGSGIRNKFPEEITGADPDFWKTHTVTPQRSFTIIDSWSDKTIKVSANAAEVGTGNYEFAIGECTPTNGSIVYSDYIHCNIGTPSLVINKTLTTSKPKFTQGLTEGDYTIILTGGAYQYVIPRSDEDYWWFSDVDISGVYNFSFYVGLEYAEETKSAAEAKAKGMGSAFTVTGEKEATFYLWLPGKEGSVSFELYKCGGSAANNTTPPTSEEPKSSGECSDADSNGDGEISLVDLSNFLSKYNTTCTKSASKTYGPCGSQDSNEDGKIGLVDLASLISKYGKSCE